MHHQVEEDPQEDLPASPVKVQHGSLLRLVTEYLLRLLADTLQVDSSDPRPAVAARVSLGVVHPLLQDGEKAGDPVVQPHVQDELEDLNDLRFSLHDEDVRLAVVDGARFSFAPRGEAGAGLDAGGEHGEHHAHLTQRPDGATLTAHLAQGQLAVGPGGDRAAVQDVEQSPRDPQQVGEAVEAEVYEMSGQLYDLINPVKEQSTSHYTHLECQLVLLRVTEGPHLVNHIPQVLLHEAHRLAEPRPHGLPAAVAGVLRRVVVVVADAELERDVGPEPRVLDWLYLADTR